LEQQALDFRVLDLSNVDPVVVIGPPTREVGRGRDIGETISDGCERCAV
jgi:hypothetical protein